MSMTVVTTTHEARCEAEIQVAITPAATVHAVLLVVPQYGPRGGFRPSRVEDLDDSLISWDSDDVIVIECPECGYVDTIELSQEV